MKAPRTIRLGLYFFAGDKHVTIYRSRNSYSCVCEDPSHTIQPGELYASVVCSRYAGLKRRTKRERWHSAHFPDLGDLVVLDKRGNEVARYEVEPSAAPVPAI